MLSVKVTESINYPNMFGSKICIFSDRHDQHKLLTQLDNNLLARDKLDLELPSVLTEISFEFRYNDNGLDGSTDYIEQWWSIGEREISDRNY